VIETRRTTIGKLRFALAILCFLALGVALGFFHRTRHLAALDRRVPMERARATLEALVLLREGREGEATTVLERHLDRTVRAIRRGPATPVGQFVVEKAVPVLETARRRGEHPAGPPPAPGDRR
jgi:hypothetical protein